MVNESLREPSSGRSRPTVGVVMPVYDVRDLVGEAIGSVLAQEGVELTLVVVDDGSTDGTAEVVAEIAARDERVRLVRAEHRGVGAARNTGVALVDATYLAFVDGDDIVPPGTYAAMAGALEASGSDLCLGGVERFDATRTWRAVWSLQAHEHALTGARLVDHPVLIKDIIACNRMIRTAFWRDRQIDFGEDSVYEDHVPMLRALVEADGIDVLDQVVYRWRVRSDGSSIGQHKKELANLQARAAAKATAWAYLAEADPVVRDAWLGRVLDIDLPPFLSLAGGASEDYLAELAALARRYVELADDRALSWVRGQHRARAWLAAQERWADLVTLSARLDETRLRELTVLEDGAVRLDPDLLPVGDLPPEWRALPDSQTAASARLLAAARRPDGRPGIRVDGAVALGGAALGSLLDRCQVVVHTPAGERPAQVRRRGKEGSAVSAGFRVELDEVLDSADDLTVVLRVEGVERSTAVRDPDDVLAGLPEVTAVPGPAGPSAPGGEEVPADRPLTAESAADLASRYGLRQVGVRPRLGRYVADIWRRRDFVRVLASASFYAENSNLYLGQVWTVLRPVLDATVYVLIFGILLDVNRGVDNVIGFIVVGTFVYRAFSESVTAGARSLARNLNLVRSLQFPRALLPLAHVSAEFLSLVPGLAVMGGFVLVSQVLPAHPEVVVSWRWLMLPVAVAMLALFAIGFGLIVARLTAFVPDILNTLPFVLRILMYASGVIFSISHYVSDPVLQRIMEMQPVAVYLNLARQSLLVEPSIPWDWTYWLVGLGWGVLTLVLGFVFFWRAEARYGRE